MSPDLGKTHLSILCGETSKGSLRGKGFVVVSVKMEIIDFLQHGPSSIGLNKTVRKDHFNFTHKMCNGN